MQKILFKSAAIILLGSSFLFGGKMKDPVVYDAAYEIYTQGYVESYLQEKLGIGPGQIVVGVEGGVVTLTGVVDNKREKEKIESAVKLFRGVQKIVSKLKIVAGSRERWKSWPFWVKPKVGKKNIYFPRGDLFAPPIADQKQPRFYMTWQRWNADFGTFNIGSVGFGENMGFVRWPGKKEGDGFQFGISGAVFAIFNLDSDSMDLLNSDYVVGFPFSFRRGEWSARARLYHQSSHLGDEYLLYPQTVPKVQRINLSFETLEFLGSYEKNGFRIYGGPSRILTSFTDLKRNRFQSGVEYRGKASGWKMARFISGCEWSSWDENNWRSDWSVKTGFAFQNPFNESLGLQVLLEYYNGSMPHGQFYQLHTNYLGLGFSFAF